MIQGFRDLNVWQKGMALATLVYQTTSKLPRGELYGLTSQLRRTAVSIPSNIAEGKAIGGQSYTRHIKIALGSEAELQTQIELAGRLKLLSDADCAAVLQRTSELGRMLVTLLNSLPKN